MQLDFYQHFVPLSGCLCLLDYASHICFCPSQPISINWPSVSYVGQVLIFWCHLHESNMFLRCFKPTCLPFTPKWLHILIIFHLNKRISTSATGLDFTKIAVATTIFGLFVHMVHESKYSRLVARILFQLQHLSFGINPIIIELLSL